MSNLAKSTPIMALSIMFNEIYLKRTLSRTLKSTRRTMTAVRALIYAHGPYRPLSHSLSPPVQAQNKPVMSAQPTSDPTPTTTFTLKTWKIQPMTDNYFFLYTNLK